MTGYLPLEDNVCEGERMSVCVQPVELPGGVPLHVVSRRLGHADVQTTMDLYGWVTEDAELRAVAGWRSFTEGWRVTGA